MRETLYAERIMGDGGERRRYRDPPPWKFSGKALYQLSLVRVEDAKAHVPKDLTLVEAFGYTLGGVYLARYDDSPCGKLDEMVVLGGLVWNAPTSCAWASRVYVDCAEARDHGVRTCGLPSRVVEFHEEEPINPKRRGLRWWGKSKRESDGDVSTVSIVESNQKVCKLKLPDEPKLKGPRISMFLPSFSGRTKSIPDLLKYSLHMRANVRLSKAIKVSLPEDGKNAPRAGAKRDPLSNILCGRPLLCIAFDNMSMDVGAPQKVDRRA